MRARLFGSICIATAITFARVTWLAAEETPKHSAPPQGSGVQNGESLSEKLDRQKGVLIPKPGIDPKAAKPPPEPNPDSMPIIRPPAKPGTEAK
jgi:hypothetical protein